MTSPKKPADAPLLAARADSSQFHDVAACVAGINCEIYEVRVCGGACSNGDWWVVPKKFGSEVMCEVCEGAIYRVSHSLTQQRPGDSGGSFRLAKSESRVDGATRLRVSFFFYF